MTWTRVPLIPDFPVCVAAVLSRRDGPQGQLDLAYRVGDGLASLFRLGPPAVVQGGEHELGNLVQGRTHPSDRGLALVEKVMCFSRAALTSRMLRVSQGC